MSMRKWFRNRIGKGFVSLLLLSSLALSGTGCGKVDNSMVNKAFANSSVMNNICAQLQEQAVLIAELQRMGIIDATMTNNLNEQLNRIYKSASTLTNGDSVTASSTTPDQNATPEPITIGTEYNDFIGAVLRSLVYLGDGPDGCTIVDDLSDVAAAEENVQKFGSPIDMYSGYHTKSLIETTGYKNIATYSADAEPLAPFGEKGNSTIVDLVDHINKLKNIQVYYINADKVSDTKSLLGLKTAMDDAKTNPSKAEELAINYFVATGEEINFTNSNLTVDNVYSPRVIAVSENGRHTISYRMLKLDRDKILGEFNKASESGDLSSGVLIGNKYFVTRYPVAVFRGFEQSTTATSKYLPVFTHPSFLSNSTYGSLKGSKFTGSEASYKDEFSSGDTGTAESKCAYVDLYTGAMYYKGEQIGNANAYMGLGTEENESSILVRPATSVYINNNNSNTITTVTQTNQFKPTEEIKLGENIKINLPGTSTNIMPVVFLMEYLELVYSPNTVGSDAFTAYGRKIRLDEKYILGKDALTASTGSVAYIVGDGIATNAWGTKVGMTGLSMTDFMDIDGIYENDATFTPKAKDETGEANKVSAAVHYIPFGTESFEKAGTVRSGDATAERSDTLPQIAAGKGVECVMRFGAEGLDAADSGSVPKTPLYGITVYGGLYTRNLFSDWINASGNANLKKWAKTLEALGYSNYAISDAVLTEKMKGNYAFELNKDGLLNLDLDTVIKINQENTEERRGAGVMYLRTILLILGFVLIAYVSVLLATWSLDVNLDLGLNLLAKVSFGHFVAVRSLDEMPEYDPNSTTMYVDYRKLIIQCLAFASVGIVLITIDPVNLIIKLLAWLRFIFDVLGEKVFGIKLS